MTLGNIPRKKTPRRAGVHVYKNFFLLKQCVQRFGIGPSSKRLVEDFVAAHVGESPVVPADVLLLGELYELLDPLDS